MSAIFLKFILAAVGFISILVAVLIFTLGPHPAFQLLGGWFELGIGAMPFITDMNTVSIDSQLRFMSVLLFAIGWVSVHCAFTYPANAHRVPYIALIFLFGGIGRVISNVTVATPNPFFVGLMWIEITIPILIIILHNRAKRKKNQY